MRASSMSMHLRLPASGRLAVARSARPRTLLLAGALAGALAVCSALLLPATGASAETPAGSRTELIFARSPKFTTPTTSGTFSGQLFGVPISGKYAPTENGCARGQSVVFAFVPASSGASEPGSAERPAVTAGDTVEGLFRWPAPDSPGDSFAYQFDPRNLVGPATDLVRLDERWPDGTALSMVSVCVTGTSADPARQLVAADSSGHAITSWVQFTTVASTTDSAKTSAGFVVGVRRETPVITLEGTDNGTSASLVARVADTRGAPLPAATGRVEFYAGTGAGRTLTATDLLVGAEASIQVPVPPPGTQVVYQADYVPDADAAGTYGASSSHRFAVVGATTALGSTTTVAADDVRFGKAASATVKVRRDGAAAGGQVALSLDGQSLPAAVLRGGRATIALPASLAAGVHTLGASYAGDQSTEPSTATGHFTVAKVDSTLDATSRRSGKAKKGHKPRRLKVIATTAALDAGDPAPTGSVEVRLGGTLLASAELTATDGGTVAIRLPRVTSKKRKVVLSVTFLGGTNFNPSHQDLTVKLPREPKK